MAEEGCKLFVYGIDQNMANGDIQSEFEKYGAVTDVYNTGKGWVKMLSSFYAFVHLVLYWWSNSKHSWFPPMVRGTYEALTSLDVWHKPENESLITWNNESLTCCL